MADRLMIRFAGGHARFIYDDRLAPVAKALGPTEVMRVSHVEPAGSISSDGMQYLPWAPATNWIADMRPVGGPILVGENHLGFATRQKALEAEQYWLRKERGL